jgi:DNA invertase Pin-like site-specific DNA recombinase
MAIEYGVSRTTFYRMLKKKEITLSRGLVTPNEQRKIYEKLGYPAYHFEPGK